MKLAIMQPYLLPYIGYFQLIACCDKFVIHDDVQYIKGGWINRNRILVNGRPQYITLPVEKAPAHLRINERSFTSDFEKQKQKMLRQIESAYRKAPYFNETMPVVKEILSCNDRSVSAFINNSLLRCCEHLDISTPFMISSELTKSNELCGEERVIEINRVVGSTHYINPAGGMELYNKDTFKRAGVHLSFLQCKDISYRQYAHDHVPCLSIVDVMMFNDTLAIQTLLKEFELL